MTYYKRIKGYDVFVTIEQPLIFNRETNQYEAFKYSCSYKFQRPLLIDGEYLRENNSIRWFHSIDEAINAGFQEAESKINPKKLSRN